MAEGGEPRRVARAPDDDDGSDEEGGRRDEEQGEDPRGGVEGAPGPGCREDTQRDADGERDEHRHQRELQRDGITPHQLVAHGEPCDERMPEVAPQHVAQPQDILHDERLVEVERVDQGLPRLLVLARGDPEEDGHEVAGNQVNEQEGEHRHADQRRDEEQEPLADVAGHTLTPVMPSPAPARARQPSHVCLKKFRLRLPGCAPGMEM